MKKVAAKQIDTLLPQTQCQLCGYAGCLPYAKAIAEQTETIDKCLPGGTRVLNQLAELLEVDATPYLPQMQQKQKNMQVAVIDEALCIGCVKCITACPVDAIIGTAKAMHTVLTQDCTGCGLCIEPCPMDCISMQATQELQSESEWQMFAEQARKLYYRKQTRTQKANIPSPTTLMDNDTRKAYIQAAITRVQQKRKEGGNEPNQTS